MSYVLRDWICRSPSCAHWFESGDAAPHCPKCKSMAKWRPSGLNIRSEATSTADTLLRQVTGRFGLSNLKSARKHESSHPGLAARKSDGKTFMGIPLSSQGATAGFAPDQPTMKIPQPINGPKFKRPAGSNVKTRVIGTYNPKTG